MHRGGRGQSFVYENPADAQPHLAGLIDVASLGTSGVKDTATTPSVRGEAPEFTAPKRVQNGADTANKRATKKTVLPNNHRVTSAIYFITARPMGRP